MSELSEQDPACCCLHVLKHLGRTLGQGTSAGGDPSGGDGLTTVEAVEVVTPPVGVTGTHDPPVLVIPDPQTVVVEPPVGVIGTHDPLSLVMPLPQTVVEPPVGVIGTQDPLSLVIPDAQVVATGVVVAGVVVRPPVGVFGTHRPPSDFSSGLQGGGVGWLESTVVLPPVGGASPHLGQNCVVEVMVVVEMVCVIEVTVPLVTVTGQVVSVTIVITVVTMSDVAVVVVRPPVGVETHSEPDCVMPELQGGGTGETLVVRGTQVPEIWVSVEAHGEVVGGLGTHDPLSPGTSPSLQDAVVVVVTGGVTTGGVVVAGVVDGGVGTHEPCSFLVSVVAHVVTGGVGTHEPCSFLVSVVAQVVTGGVVVVVVTGVVTGGVGTQVPELMVIEVPHVKVEVVLVLEVVLVSGGLQSNPMLWNPKLQSPLTLTFLAPPH